MSVMSWIPPATAEPKYSEWDVENEGRWRFVGSIPPDGRPLYYNHHTQTIHRGNVDHEAERLVPDERPSWEMNPEETLGQFLERVGEETGIDSLSEFARDHLEDDGTED